MNTPKSTIGVFSPSSWVEKSDIEESQRFAEQHGFGVYIHPQTYARDNQSAGTHKDKLLALYDLWANPEIDIIWAAGGGNRCLHWIDLIDYPQLTADKPVVGFSDVTALLNALYAHKGQTGLHGPTFNRLHKSTHGAHILDILKGDTVGFDFSGAEVFREGEAEGHLIGGNLSVFQYLPHTLPGKFWEGSILFLEDCNEELSKIDRMILHLRRTKVLENVSGIMLGEFGNLPETGRPYGFTMKDIIREHAHDLDIPIILNAPFGHGKNLVPLPVGNKAHFSVTANQILFELV